MSWLVGLTEGLVVSTAVGGTVAVIVIGILNGTVVVTPAAVTLRMTLVVIMLEICCVTV